MTDEYTIHQLPRDHPDFYRLMGPAFGSRAVAKALGGSLYDDPALVWYLALHGEWELAGFAAHELTRGGAQGWLRHAYVYDAHRGHGIYDALFRTRLDALRQAGAKCIWAVLTPCSLETAERYGFHWLADRGQYKLYGVDL